MAFMIARSSRMSVYVHTPFPISFYDQQVLTVTVCYGFGIPQSFLAWRQCTAFGADLFHDLSV